MGCEEASYEEAELCLQRWQGQGARGPGLFRWSELLEVGAGEGVRSSPDLGSPGEGWGRRWGSRGSSGGRDWLLEVDP